MVAGSRDDGPVRSITESRHTSDKRPVFILDNRIDSRELFSASREVTIAHGEDIYRLRLTSQNKLILTK
jgi:hemin uptake protein HemP